MQNVVNQKGKVSVGQKAKVGKGEQQFGIDPRYKGMTCYNCGEPGHFVGICDKPKICFICAVPGHYMTACPEWQKKHPVADYMGSASDKLGFFHVQLPEAETTRWLNISNCGLVKIKSGSVTMAELEKELSEIFCKEWPWQIRELTASKFLVRFPPHKKVSDIQNLPSFNLRKEGVQVEVTEWSGDIDHFSELKEAWVQIEGIPPKWCDWKVFAQVTSAFGMMTEVDWSFLFKSFYEKVRVKMVCRDPTQILFERLFEMDKKIYMVSFMVEGFEQMLADKGNPGDDEDGDDDSKGDAENDDEADDLGDINEEMDTDKDPKTPQEPSKKVHGSKTVNQAEQLQSPEMIANMYEHADPEEEGEESQSRWQQFLAGHNPTEKDCDKMLMEMELLDEKAEEHTMNQEDSFELSKEMVDAIEKARQTKTNQKATIKLCAKNKWGPIMIERKKRRQEDGLTVMQRAMSLKKQWNLELPNKKGRQVDKQQRDSEEDDEDVKVMAGPMQGRGGNRDGWNGARTGEAGLCTIHVAVETGDAH